MGGESIEYLFGYSQGWYLKIDTIEKLIDYHKKMIKISMKVL